MRSHQFNTRYPVPVFEGMMRRKKVLGYRTMGAFQTNLNRCDLVIQRDHDWSRWMDAQTQEDQDFIDDCLRDFTKSVPGKHPTLSHIFCNGIINVMMARRGCSAKAALRFLPDSVRELCIERGFA